MSELIQAALVYHSLGLKVCPVNGKRPFGKWDHYKIIDATKHIIEKFEDSRTDGVAIFCGSCSGNIECIDIDCKYDLSGDLFESFMHSVNAISRDLASKIIIEGTKNRGYHLIYRCATIGNNLKLASRFTTDEERKTNPKEKVKILIETRGEGGIVVVSPTPGYKIVQGSLNKIPEITPAERNTLFEIARSFHEPDLQDIQVNTSSFIPNLSTYDDYNQQANILQLLTDAGWKIVWEKDNKVAVLRPGGDTSSNPHSGYVFKDRNLFYCFSTSTEFDTKKTYNAVGVYAVYNHQGDFKAAVKDLATQGFGHQRNQLTSSTNNQNEEEDSFSSTPCFEDHVYDRLPNLLKEACSIFKDPREKDVYLLGSLGVMSGCLPMVNGLYHNKFYHPNISAFIVAPAGAGKGVLNWSKEWGMKLHIKKLEASSEAKEQYKRDLAKYKNADKKDKVNSTHPEPPSMELLFIPANISHTGLLQTLYDNNGEGIMFETEADTFNNIKNNEWANLDDILRKVFHHETISYKRKTNDEYKEVESPKLSIIFSGTPDQFFRLVMSVENGLFSRFAYYVFSSEPIWKSPYNNNRDYKKHFKDLGENFDSLLKNLPAEIKLSLTKIQVQLIDETFRQWQNEFFVFVGEDSLAIIRRLGLIFFRICMVLTVIRLDRNTHNQVDSLCCDDDAFICAKSICNTLRQHAALLYHKLPHKSSRNHLNNNQQLFYKSLPYEFSRKDYLEKAKELEINANTAKKYVDKYVKYQLVIKSDYNAYIKAN